MTKRSRIAGLFLVFFLVFAGVAPALGGKGAMTADDYNDRGVQQLLNGHPREAAASFEKAIALNPTDAIYYSNYAAACRDLGEYDKAITAYTKAITLKPNEPSYYSGRGAIYGLKGDYSRSISDFSRAIKLEPEEINHYRNRGLAYLKKGDYDRAISDFTKVIEKKPFQHHIYFMRGLAHFHKGNYNQAVIDFTQVTVLNPKDVEAYRNRGTSYSKRGDYAQALANYTRAIQLKPDSADFYYLRGETYRRLGKHGKAISDFLRFIKLKPNIPGGYNGLAAAYAEAGQFDRAVAAQQKVIALVEKHGAKPGTIKALKKMLQAYREHRAVSSGKPLLERIPASRFAWPKKVFYTRDNMKIHFNFVIRSFYPLSRVEVRDENGKRLCALIPVEGFDFFWGETLVPYTYQGALNRYASSVHRYRLYVRDTMGGEALSPFYGLKKIEGISALAVTIEGASRKERAIDERIIHTCTLKIDHDPNNVDAYIRRAEIYAKRGHLDKALKDYTRVLTLNPDHAGALRARAKIYREEEKFGLALADLSRLIRLNPHDYDAYVARIKIHVQRHEYDKAAQDCEALLRIKPGDRELQKALVGLYVETHQYKKAVDTVTGWLRAETDKAKRGLYYVLRGSVHYYLGGKEGADKAVADLTRALETRKKFGKSLEDVKKNRKMISETADIYEVRSKAYQVAGKIAEARKDREKVKSLRALLGELARREREEMRRRRRERIRRWNSSSDGKEKKGHP